VPPALTRDLFMGHKARASVFWLSLPRSSSAFAEPQDGPPFAFVRVASLKGTPREAGHHGRSRGRFAEDELEAILTRLISDQRVVLGTARGYPEEIIYEISSFFLSFSLESNSRAP